MSVKETGDLRAFVRQLEAIANTAVYVGIPGESSQRISGDAKNVRTADEPTNVDLGYIHEYGTNTGIGGHVPIPPRPFLHPGVSKATAHCVELLKIGVAESLEKRSPAPVLATLDEAGLHAVSVVRGMFDTQGDASWPQLAKGTLYKRRQRGRSGTRPLLDTGQLRNSITYIIKSK